MCLCGIYFVRYGLMLCVFMRERLHEVGGHAVYVEVLWC